MSEVLSVEEAERLAAATLDKINAMDNGLRSTLGHRRLTADREQVESDLVGLREHRHVPGPSILDQQLSDTCAWGMQWPCPDARRYSDGLRRTAALYGVER